MFVSLKIFMLWRELRRHNTCKTWQCRKDEIEWVLVVLFLAAL